MKAKDFKGKGGKQNFEQPKRRETENRNFSVEPPKRREAEKKQFGERNDRGGNDNSRRANSSAQMVYGVLPVLESMRANSRRIEKIYVAEGAREKRLSEIFDLARQNNITVNKISRENLGRMVDPNANHQGVIALTASADYVSPEEILDEIDGNALLVVLDGVEDPRNLGAVLRSVEGANADGVFIPERRAVGLTETVAKSSAGAIEYVKVAKVGNINRLIEELKERNIWTVGTSAEAETEYSDWDWTQPSALILGGEGKGLHRLVAENCDVLVKIPMYGKVESLNVSVAAGVILFEAKRQRKNDDLNGE
ncbi:MAG: rRNA methylase, putative, group 3 [Acidobacteria bacterium]|nr:rRNA methylase, putative, group 3 [Acidobacteriota bacterium]